MKFLYIFSGKPVIFEISKVEVTKDFEPDNELATALEKYSEKMEVELIKELGEFECDLEGRFSLIRTQETNLGNFICDIMVIFLNIIYIYFRTRVRICARGQAWACKFECDLEGGYFFIPIIRQHLDRSAAFLMFS